MKWKSGRRSKNVEDRRSRRGPSGFGGRRGNTQLLRLLFSRGPKFGFTALAGILLVVYLMGGNPLSAISFLMGGTTAPVSVPKKLTTKDKETGDFLSVVLADTEDTWGELLPGYVPPTLVLFSDAVSSACGYSSAATGPFYCPLDQKLYMDTSFLDELRRMGGKGDFAAAYVIAHEIGHHVQQLQGVLSDTRQVQAKVGEEQRNALQVKVELQADCYAGVWAQHAQTELDPGDIDEAMQAAAAVGDDTLQKQAGRKVRPETFTHGSARQRVDAFRRGFETGDVTSCSN